MDSADLFIAIIFFCFLVIFFAIIKVIIKVVKNLKKRKKTQKAESKDDSDDSDDLLESFMKSYSEKKEKKTDFSGTNKKRTTTTVNNSNYLSIQQPYDMDSKIAQRVGDFMISHNYEATTFVLHTSCAKSSMTELNALFKESEFIPRDKTRFILPRNVYYELKILEGSPNYKRQSAMIRYNSFQQSWSLQQLYHFTSDNEKVRLSDIKSKNRIENKESENLVFIFNDSAAFDEFIKYVKAENRVYAINLDRRVPGYETIIQPLSNFRRYTVDDEKNGWKENSRYRRVDKVGKKKPAILIEDMNDNEKLYIGYPMSSRIINVGALKSQCIKRAGEAAIYKLPNRDDKLVKIYIKDLPDSRKINKLKCLINSTNYLPFEKLSLPEELIYNSNGECVGFTMRKINGKNIGDSFFARKRWNDSNGPEVYKEKRKVLQNFSKLLLELQMADVYVADLSLNNVLVDDDNNVYIIDCDSFEIPGCPGEGVTDVYRHPNLDDNRDLLYHMREPRIHSFSFAVAVFQISIGCVIHPLYQCGEEEPKWGDQKFPFNFDEPDNNSPYIYESWREMLNSEQRALFTKEFKFMATQGLGDWIAAFT